MRTPGRRYLPDGLFAEHPEYFAMGKDGQRHGGDWICTSNPQLRALFAQRVIAAIESGQRHPSLSPTDGRGYCQCPACLAQDDPKVIEPSTGTVAVSNRYADFFDAIGRQVAPRCPDSILSFYCYADYTQPPTLGRKLSPNLCAVIAPIRYCRLHAIGDPHCPSRSQQVEMLEGWAKTRAAPRLLQLHVQPGRRHVAVLQVHRLQEGVPLPGRQGAFGDDHRSALELAHLRAAHLPRHCGWPTIPAPTPTP